MNGMFSGSIAHMIALGMIFFSRTASSLPSLVPTCHDFSRSQALSKQEALLLFHAFYTIRGASASPRRGDKAKDVFELLALRITVK
jgi:hypothetical protein